MNLQLQENKRVIRHFVQANWSDQKLHDVYAFNRDGKMTFQSSCACILGVTGSEVLHNESSKCKDHRGDGAYIQGHYGAYIQGHYKRVRKGIPDAVPVENAYQFLGYSADYVSLTSDASTEKKIAIIKDCNNRRQHRLSAILRAEIRARAKKIAPSAQEEPVLCSSST